MCYVSVCTSCSMYMYLKAWSMFLSCLEFSELFPLPWPYGYFNHLKYIYIHGVSTSILVLLLTFFSTFFNKKYLKETTEYMFTHALPV